ncbi:MFS polyamine transporter [Mycena venus]|uniref:MFS polyamine transporter n=1 Tax=Mycena venus TaxID=2733690 RepID=A0A8H6YD78_9AGAR|nr:MFS polyamine transporter [Mycena venus]
MAPERETRNSPLSTVSNPQTENEKGSELFDSPPLDIVVDWEGPDDPLNPKNWNRKKKWAATLIVSAFALLTPVASSMITPASPQVALQFGIISDVTIALITSIFILGYIVGPLFLGPLSEIFGRNRVIQGANLWFMVWNLACGFAQNSGQLLAFRLLAGLGGSAPLAIAAAVIGDIWAAEERGQALAIYSLAPLLGPVAGPLCGAFVAERITWRWVFWSTTILTTIIQILGVFYLRESYAPFILERKANRIRRSLDAEKGPVPNVRSKFANEDRTWQRIMKIALTRPFILFCHEPIVQLLGVYMAFVYGIFYLFVTSMPLMFQGIYGESVSISGLNYLALGIGVTGASQINAQFMDYIFKYLKDKNGGVKEPEYRIPSMVPGTIALPVGLLITGWAVQARVHWIVADIYQGITLVGAGIIVTFQAMQIYVVDAFPLYAASALAAVSFLRSLCGFGFPLFAPAMYMKLGYGKGDTILAVIGIVIGCPAPWLFWRYGKQIRMKSKYVK